MHLKQGWKVGKLMIMEIVNDKQFEVYANKLINREEIAKIIVKTMKNTFNATIGRPTKTGNKFYYEVDGDNIKIMNKTPVPIFIDKGTKPHEIRAKNKKALSFRAGRQMNIGNKIYQPGDDVALKSVKHPGFVATPFIEVALKLSQNQIKEKLFKS